MIQNFIEASRFGGKVEFVSTDPAKDFKIMKKSGISFEKKGSQYTLFSNLRFEDIEGEKLRAFTAAINDGAILTAWLYGREASKITQATGVKGSKKNSKRDGRCLYEFKPF